MENDRGVSSVVERRATLTDIGSIPVRHTRVLTNDRTMERVININSSFGLAVTLFLLPIWFLPVMFLMHLTGGMVRFTTDGVLEKDGITGLTVTFGNNY